MRQKTRAFLKENDPDWPFRLLSPKETLSLMRKLTSDQGCKPTLEELRTALIGSWSKETAHRNGQAKWRPNNPALGQCAVTALVVQDYFRGDLVYCMHKSHYWNRLPNRIEVDLTRGQFAEGTWFCCDGTDERGYLLEGEMPQYVGTPIGYLHLKKKVEEFLEKPRKFQQNLVIGPLPTRVC